MNREDIENILIRFTDITGYDHSQKSNLAFKAATGEIERLLADERERYLKRLREERGLFALSLQMLAGKDFSAADKLATIRFATWEEVNGEAERARTLIRQLALTAPDTDEVSFVCTHCNNAGPLSECLGKQYERITGPRCPRCDYCVQVLRKPKLTAPSSTEEKENG